MIGSIIGDIAGSRFEFDNAKSDRFALFARDCSFTDDTICTVAIADAILNGKFFSDALREWGRAFPHPMGGYGASFSQWLNYPEPAVPYWSFGNGAAMRVSPIGLAYDTVARIATEAANSAACTHDHPEGIKGAVTTALGCLILRRTGDKDAFRAELETQYGTLPEYRPFSNAFDESCMNAVPVAASCLLASNDFEDAIRKAILVGGDSDTIAAIVGGWAEALYGVPDELQKEAGKYLPSAMKEVVREFYDRIGKPIAI